MASNHLSGAKKKSRALHAALLHTDEASFRQDSTLHATWSRRAHQPTVPVTGARKSVKVFGAVEVFEPRFHHHRDTVFDATTYITFLEHLARAYHPRKVMQVQDNASYHKDAEVRAWYRENRRWWTPYYLPPYSPEFNAAEPIWHHTRKEGTHNKYFATIDELLDVLDRVFRSIQRYPAQISGYVAPFVA